MTTATPTRLIRLATIALLALAWSTASAGVITLYSENFEQPVGTANPSPLSAAGWKAVGADGTTLTSSTIESNGKYVSISGDSDMEGAWRTFFVLRSGDPADRDLFVWTEEVNFNLEDWTDLTVSFMHRETGSPSYRMALKIDGTWYVDDSIAGSTTLKTETITLANRNTFDDWVGAPANDTDTWSTPSFDDYALPAAGNVSAFGFVLPKPNNNEVSIRFDAVTITGIPEPSSGLLVLLGGLALMRRRRK